MKRIAVSLLALCFSSGAQAEVSLPSIVGDHMILQCGVKANLWGWADQGEEVTVQFAGQTQKALPDANGRWQVTLDPMGASSAGADLTVKGSNSIVVKDVLVGEVWLASGQSNMVSGIKQVPGDEKAVYFAQKENKRVRIFIGDRWMLCSQQALSTSAVGFFFALKLQQELDVPVAYVVVARLGSRIEPFIPAREYEAAGLKNKGSTIFDSSIAPLTSYAINGAIWYQGESNRGSTDYYQSLKALSAGWSRAFDLPDIPLYLVQVAPFDYSRKGQRSSLLAETVWAAQYRAAKEIPGIEVVAIHDTDINVKMIHPRRKKPVGERLAAMALKHQYGKKVSTSGPVFAKAIIQDANVIVSFAGIGQGLSTKDGKPPTCFELSEDGETFVEATAEIDGNRVRVHSKAVSTPEFIRMGWFDTATPTLQDKNGWPVFAFAVQAIEKD